MSYSMDIYKSLNIKIEKAMTNSKLLKFVRIILKLKKCVSIQLKNYLIY